MFNVFISLNTSLQCTGESLINYSQLLALLSELNHQLKTNSVVYCSLLALAYIPIREVNGDVLVTSYTDITPSVKVKDFRVKKS